MLKRQYYIAKKHIQRYKTDRMFSIVTSEDTVHRVVTLGHYILKTVNDYRDNR